MAGAVVVMEATALAAVVVVVVMEAGMATEMRVTSLHIACFVIFGTTSSVIKLQTCTVFPSQCSFAFCNL